MTPEEFNAQLQWALNFAMGGMNKATVSLGFLEYAQVQAKQLATITAERDELRAGRSDLLTSLSSLQNEPNRELIAANKRAHELEVRLDASRFGREALVAQLAAVPTGAIREAHHFCSVAFHPTANLDVMLGDWWAPLTKWLNEVAP